MLDVREILNNLLEAQVHGGSGVDVGTITEYAGIFPPDGWIICDGRALSRTVYEELFDAIGTNFGSGDGSTTFNIPDLRGRTAIGVGNSGATGSTNHTLGQKSGKESAPEHKHDLLGTGVALIGNYSDTIAFNNANVSNDYLWNTWTSLTGGTSYSWTHNADTAVTASTPHYNEGRAINLAGSTGNRVVYSSDDTNMQPYLTVNYIIFTGVYQTVAAATTWTSLQDRISNSQLNIPVTTNFQDPVNIKNAVNFQGNSFSVTNPAAFRTALGVSQTGGYAFQRYTGDTTLSTAGQTISFSVTITTHGRPVVIIATSTWNGSGAGYWSSIYISRGSTVLQQATMVSSSSSYNVPGAVMALETLAAGTYTYTCTLYLGSGGGTFSENNAGRSEAPSLLAFEI